MLYQWNIIRNRMCYSDRKAAREQSLSTWVNTDHLFTNLLLRRWSNSNLQAKWKWDREVNKKALSMNSNLFFQHIFHTHCETSHVIFNRHLSKSQWKDKSGSQKVPEKSTHCIVLTFPACVTCCYRATSLDHIYGAAVMVDKSVKCTRGPNLCLCWHPVFTVTVTYFGLSWGGVWRHISATVTLIFTESCQSHQEMPESMLLLT